MSSFVTRTGKFAKGIFGLNTPASPDVPVQPEPPTIDNATQNRDELDRLRKRKGVLANIFGGGSSTAPAPSVGSKTLLGG